MRRRHFVGGLLAALAFRRPARAAGRSLAELGRRFAALRKRRAANDHDASVYSWGGELHQVMTELGERLGAAGTPASRVRQIMGEPDERTPERWIYQWRGGHDYLFFDIAKDRVVRADWYMAGE